MKPLCFVLMPFGTKPDGTGVPVDFDAVFRELIAPAIAAADFEPLRADEEQVGGIIHKPMFERLLLCEYAVADLTTANANVFYELGVRHVVRPWSTVLVHAEGGRLPFDIAPQRTLPYRLTPAGTPADVDVARDALVKRLSDARAAQVDSPIYELVEGFPQPVLESLKLESFRDQVRNAAELKEQIATAQARGLDALRKVEHELEPLADADSGVVIYLFRAYAAVEGWAEMIALVEQMSPPLAATAMVQEQFALALNRNEEPERALRVLHELLARRGPSSETYGILGRVHKDEWNRAKNRGEATRARGELTKAIAAYVKGFETDWRDPYPGVNALTLMEAQDPPDPRSEVLLPVVEYAVERRIERGEPTYWDHATRLELAVLRRNEQRGGRALEDALAAVSDTFSPSTTANNLRIIREARAARGETVPWSDEAERELRAAAGDG